MENTVSVQPRHRLPADLAAALRAHRLRRGLGLRATASAAGISPGYLTLLEQGKRCPSVAVAELIAAALRLGPDLDARLFDVAQPYAGRSRTSSQPSREVTQPDAPSSAQVADATDEGSAAPPKSAKNAPIGDIKAGHAARAHEDTKIGDELRSGCGRDRRGQTRKTSSRASPPPTLTRPTSLAHLNACAGRAVVSRDGGKRPTPTTTRSTYGT